MVRPHILLLVIVVITASVLPALGVKRCGSADARNFGVKGNEGLGDDAPALKAADNDPGSPYLYAAPEGNVFNSRTLQIKTSVELKKPLVLSFEMKVKIAMGAVLTLRSQPVFHRTGLFEGEGQVKFAGPTKFIVIPEWWGGDRADRGLMMSQVAAACKGVKCAIVWTVPFMADITRPITITPNLQFYTPPYNPGIKGNGPAVAVDFRPGNYGPNKAYTFPSLIGTKPFSAGIQASATKGLKVFAESVADSKDAVLLRGAVSANTMQLGLPTRVNNVFALDALSLRGTRLYCGFTVGTRDGSSSLVNFRRSPRTLAGTSVTFTSADGNTPNPDVALVRNSAAAPIRGFNFFLTTWGGGYNSAVKLVSGAFTGLKALMRMNADWGADMKGSATIQLGHSNEMLPHVRLASTPEGATTVMLHNYHTVELQPDDIQYPWNPDERKSFYVRHAFLADGRQTKMTMTPGPFWPAFSYTNPGIVVENLIDRGNQLLEIKLNNINVSPINRAYFDAWFKVQRWRLIVGVEGIGA